MSFRTFIVTAADAPLARDIAALTGGGSGMFVTALSPTGADPATHYVSTGLVPDAFAAACDYPGDADAVYKLCKSCGLPVTLAKIKTLLKNSDVTQQEPFAAFERLGLQLIQPADQG